MKRSALLFLLPLTIQATCLQLPQAQKAGIAQRPLLQASKQDIVAALHEQSRVQGQLLPQINAAHSSLFTNVLATNETAHTITLQGSQVIFNAPTTLIQGKVAQLTTERSSYQYAARSNDVRKETAIAFLQAWLLQEKAALIQALDRYATALEEKNNAQKTQGTITAVAWAATAANIAHHRATIASYPAALACAHQTLRHLMGENPHDHTSAPTYLNYDILRPLPLLEASEVYVQLAYHHRPELKDKEAAQKQQALIARSHRLSYVPTLSAVGSVSHSYAGARITHGTTTSLSLSINWRLFDGMQAAHAAQAADASKLRAQFEQQELKSALALEIGNLCRSMHTASILLHASILQVEAQKALLAQVQATLVGGSVERLLQEKARYEYEAAAHEMRAQRITLHTHWHTLAWLCGYPSSGAFDEL